MSASLMVVDLDRYWQTPRRRPPCLILRRQGVLPSVPTWRHFAWFAAVLSP